MKRQRFSTDKTLLNVNIHCPKRTMYGKDQSWSLKTEYSREVFHS